MSCVLSIVKIEHRLQIINDLLELPKTFNHPTSNHHLSFRIIDTQSHSLDDDSLTLLRLPSEATSHSELDDSHPREDEGVVPLVAVGHCGDWDSSSGMSHSEGQKRRRSGTVLLGGCRGDAIVPFICVVVLGLGSGFGVPSAFTSVSSSFSFGVCDANDYR